MKTFCLLEMPIEKKNICECYVKTLWNCFVCCRSLSTKAHVFSCYVETLNCFMKMGSSYALKLHFDSEAIYATFVNICFQMLLQWYTIYFHACY